MGKFGQVQKANTRAFLATGDTGAFAGKPLLDIPYGDP
jgi:hypothetical protein